MKDNNNVFLTKIAEKIKRGDYDKHINLPFMTQELVLTCIKIKFARKIESGGTPVLNDAEVKDCINQARETAAVTYGIFEKYGIIERTEEGYKITPKGELALKARK